MSHVMVWRGSGEEDGLAGFWHHGILCPDGTVIHYAGTPGAKTLHDARIRRTPMSEFAVDGQHRVHTVAYDVHPYTPEEVVRRAESRVGREGYDFMRDNCESFARWCVGGGEISFQSGGVVLGVLAGLGSLVMGGGVLGAALTAVVLYKVWDRGANHSAVRELVGEESDSDEEGER